MTIEVNETVGTAAAAYSRLEQFRLPYLRRARQCAELTIPALMPPEGWTGTQDLYTPFQSMGARGTNNLSAKMLMALFPPNTPCFRYRIDEFTAEAMKAETDQKAQVESRLAQMERAITIEIETQRFGPSIFEGLKQLVVAGNVLLYAQPLGGLRLFRLDRYVIKRDPSGNVLEMVTKEDLAPSVLRSLLSAEDYASLGDKMDPDSKDAYKTCALYTHIQRGDNKWTVYQEVHGKRVGESGDFPLDELPYIPLRWTAIDGEDYGRGYVEEYLGSFQSLEGLRQAVVEGSVAASKIIPLVNPNGVTKKKDLESANGKFVSGVADDVHFLQMEKYYDFKTAKEEIDTIIQELAYAFMLTSAIQRDAERVTAEEVRRLAQDLEAALGGVYSVQGAELQLPLIKIVQARMQKAGRLPTLPKGTVKVTIVTGLEALGRGHDLNKLDVFIGGANAQLTPEVTMKYVNVSEYLERRATALGIETNGLIRTPEEVAQSDQQAQMQAMVSQLGPEAIKSLTTAGVTRAKLNAEAGAQAPPA